jgi:hypothetical protein
MKSPLSLKIAVVSRHTPAMKATLSLTNQKGQRLIGAALLA